MPFVIGETVGPYQILDKLGRGGMAKVFKAYHPALDRYVAIKALHPAFLEDPNFLARFQREARVVAKLEHPNIVPVYDFAEHEGRPYLVMKFIEGETLKARLSRSSMDKDELITIVYAVGEALTYAHNRGILHRDVKPSNVLIGDDERIYLADFGLARIAQVGESTLSSDMMLGTPQYISPEQAMGSGDLDEGTDIYSFGVMLYELIVGQVPFSGDTPFSIIHDHIYTPLPLPKQINPGVSDAVERVLLKALAKERHDRFKEVGSLVDSFLAAISAHDILDQSVEDTRSEVSEPVVITAEGAGSEGTEPEIIYVEDHQHRVKDPPYDNDPTSFDLETKVAPRLTAKEIEGVDFDSLTRPQGKQKRSKPRRRWKWWQIALSLSAFIICCFAGLVVISRIQQNNQATPTVRSGQEDGTPDDQALAYVLEQVERNPEEPQYKLDLASVYLDLGRYGDAIEVIQKAFLISDGNQAILMRGIDLLALRGDWVILSSTLLALNRTHPEYFTEQIYDRFAEAAYMAADYPSSEKNVPISKISEVDEALERVIKARHTLLHGDPVVAQEILDEVLKDIWPGMPEALLLQAEISFKMGDRPYARQILSALETRDDVPDWVLSKIESMVSDFWENVETVENRLEANPDDPWVHLEMLDVRMAAGDYEAADAEVRKIMELGGNDPEILFNTGEILANHGIYTYAAAFYIQSANIDPEPSSIVDEKIQMCVYLSGAMEDGYEVLSNPELGLDPDLLSILDARHELYYGDLNSAVRKIQTLLDEEPNLSPEILLQAEKHIAFEEIQAAQALLKNITEDDSKPFWIRKEAGILLAKIFR